MCLPCLSEVDPVENMKMPKARLLQGATGDCRLLQAMDKESNFKLNFVKLFLSINVIYRSIFTKCLEFEIEKDEYRLHITYQTCVCSPELRDPFFPVFIDLK